MAWHLPRCASRSRACDHVRGRLRRSATTPVLHRGRHGADAHDRRARSARRARADADRGRTANARGRSHHRASPGTWPVCACHCRPPRPMLWRLDRRRQCSGRRARYLTERIFRARRAGSCSVYIDHDKAARRAKLTDATIVRGATGFADSARAVLTLTPHGSTAVRLALAKANHVRVWEPVALRRGEHGGLFALVGFRKFCGSFSGNSAVSSNGPDRRIVARRRAGAWSASRVRRGAAGVRARGCGRRWPRRDRRRAGRRPSGFGCLLVVKIIGVAADVAVVDDVVEDVRGVVAVGEVADLVDDEHVGPDVAARAPRACGPRGSPTRGRR